MYKFTFIIFRDKVFIITNKMLGPKAQNQNDDQALITWTKQYSYKLGKYNFKCLFITFYLI